MNSEDLRSLRVQFYLTLGHHVSSKPLVCLRVWMCGLGEIGVGCSGEVASLFGVK